MKSLFSDELLARLHRTGVVACLTIEEPHHAVPVARALLAGGIDVMELTLRTPKSLDALRRIVAEVPEMLAGVGTILKQEQIKEVCAAGGKFGVSPGLTDGVVKAAQDAGLPFAPGIATASELQRGVELGCREMKLFPAEPLGGVAYLKSVSQPFMHLGIRLIPLGGLNYSNMTNYLREPVTLALGGSWLVTKELLQEENWATITRLSEEAMTVVRQRFGEPSAFRAGA
ncbi:MAG: bifunctional 4-hydroxy-2-oxoglutarate aldolase/2-dehydro-3-deoxy-phosphogluconate aldolase [Thermoguttaceae bacterium]